MKLNQYKENTSKWFKELRNQICKEFELIEQNYMDYCNQNNLPYQKKENKFTISEWKRTQENSPTQDYGGGEMSTMQGNVFESVAVNISTVWGEFSDKLLNEIKNNQKEFQTSSSSQIQDSNNISNNKKFFATGISLIAHMQNPYVPAVHMNTRFITSGENLEEKFWFGGGADLTPLYPITEDSNFFHTQLKNTCDQYDPLYYPKFKKQCDEYFYLPHRQEPRGIGGIFYDYLNNNNFEFDFNFTKSIGECFKETYANLVRKNMHTNFNQEDREKLFLKRGRYVEFNLLYDRGTRFGLLTGGNINSILSSLPPIVKWNIGNNY